MGLPLKLLDLGHKKRGDSNNHPKIMRMKPGFIFAFAVPNICIKCHNWDFEKDYSKVESSSINDTYFLQISSGLNLCR
jgi:hypothetical protein